MPSAGGSTGRARGHRRVPGEGLTGIHEMGVDLVALARVSAARRARAVSVPQLRGGGRPLEEAWDEYRERGPESIGDGRVIVGALKLMARRRARLARGRAARAVLRRSRQPRAPADPAGGARAGSRRGDARRLPGVRARDRGPREHARRSTRSSRPGAAPAARRARFRVEHAQILTETDIPRFRALGVVPSMQATHCTSDMAGRSSGSAPTACPAPTPGARCSAPASSSPGGSDFPVESPNPFHGIYAAVARRPPDGRGRGWQPEQRMTRQEAVRSFTTWNAYAATRRPTWARCHRASGPTRRLLRRTSSPVPRSRSRRSAPC